MIKTKFFQACIGVSIVLLSLSAFFYSIQTATASPTPDKFFQANDNKIGKYMMQVYSYGSDGRRYAMVWDTETGKSKGYYQIGTDWTVQKGLPDNPLGN